MPAGFGGTISFCSNNVEMVQVIFIEPDGRRVEVSAEAGMSCMEAARSIRVAGIVAECGGSAACGTCHGYVDEPFLSRLPPPEPQQDQILDCTASSRRPNSRLSCQLRLTDSLDGVILKTPETQL
jgi:2Fe-2S ferredoxin